MGQTQALAIQDLFKSLGLIKSKVRPLCFAASFEIYGPKVQDLLNNRERLEVLEDEKGRIEIVGLAKVPVQSADDLAGLLEEASAMRTTQKTDANDASSRSHSITQIFLHPAGDSEAEKPHVGVLTVVDLAGSERGQDTKSHNRQLRTEGAEINKVGRNFARWMHISFRFVSFYFIYLSSPFLTPSPLAMPLGPLPWINL